MNGNVRLLESVRLPYPRRAILRVLDEEPRGIKPSPGNRELSDALNEAYANDTDEDEKEFLRLARVKQSKILDEWK